MKTLTSLPLRAWVVVQTNGLAAAQSLTDSTKTRRGRLEVAAGTLLAFLANSQLAFAAESLASSESKIVSLIKRLTLALLVIVGAVGLLFLGVAAILWMTAGGNSTQLSKAKTTAKNVLIGYALAACIFIIPRLLFSLIGDLDGSGSKQSIQQLEKGGGLK